MAQNSPILLKEGKAAEWLPLVLYFSLLPHEDPAPTVSSSCLPERVRAAHGVYSSPGRRRRAWLCFCVSVGGADLCLGGIILSPGKMPRGTELWPHPQCSLTFLRVAWSCPETRSSPWPAGTRKRHAQRLPPQTRQGSVYSFPFRVPNQASLNQTKLAAFCFDSL